MSVASIPPSILLADGDALSRTMFENFFERRGWVYEVVAESELLNNALENSCYDIVIADEMGVIGLAGVVGAKRAETTDASKELLIEVASLDKTAVRRSALNHKIRTEASSRFEKGLPLPLPPTHA